MTPEWQAKIDEAQEEPTVAIGGGIFNRVRYGEEYGPRFDYKPACWDCGCELGQVHVTTCSVERCPVCSGQASGCGCGSGEA
jgi:hypothetical protein